MYDLEVRARERLATLKAERERRAVELAQFDAAIGELELLLAPPAPEPLTVSRPSESIIEGPPIEEPTNGRVERGRPRAAAAE